MPNKRGREHFTVGSTPYRAPAFGALRVDPCYSVNDQQRAHIISHRAAALDYPALAT